MKNPIKKFNVGPFVRYTLGKLGLLVGPNFRRELKFRAYGQTGVSTLNLWGWIVLVWNAYRVPFTYPAEKLNLTLRAEAGLGRAQQRGEGVRVLADGNLQLSLKDEFRFFLLDELVSLNEAIVVEWADFSGLPEFRAEVDAAIENSANSWKGNRGLNAMEFETLQPYVENGDFDFLRPEDVGAMTDSILIGVDIEFGERDDKPILHDDSLVFWYPNYAIESFLQPLLEKGEVIFISAGN